MDINNFKNFLFKNEDQIILGIGFILVAILAFGAGKLSETYTSPSPIIIKDDLNCAENQTVMEKKQDANITSEKKGEIIGNKNSRIYHLPGSASYNKISPENRVYFNTEIDAQKAGYRKTKM